MRKVEEIILYITKKDNASNPFPLHMFYIIYNLLRSD